MRWKQSLHEMQDPAAEDSDGRVAQVEALRAIAEELEKGNALLERVLERSSLWRGLPRENFDEAPRPRSHDNSPV